MFERLKQRLAAPVDIASLAMLRILYGALMTAWAVRFISEGWVERVYVQPSFFFKYWGFEWARVLSPEAMLALHVVIAVSAALVMLGWRYRMSMAVFLVSFVYADLCDVTTYLNHHYQAVLLGVIGLFLPLNAAWSLDARRDPRVRREQVPAFMVYLVRFQVGVVYLFAAVAKAQPDWLVHAQPLGIWLASRHETPLLGSLFAQPYAPYLFSWAGFLFDLTIVGWLSWRRSRPVAYAVVLVFHTLTNVLFNIGIFPLLMMLTTPIFFSPSWPRNAWAWVRGRLGRGQGVGSVAPHAPSRATEQAPRVRPVLLAGLALYVAVQVLLPLRAFAYGGNVLWHEQGMRYSWRVMVRTKSGAVSYRVRAAGLPREQRVEPCRYLSSYQEREMSGQPDLILQLAHRIAADYRARGHEDVEVRVDALVSLNGRPPVAMIDPEVDLARVHDGLAHADWVLPAPDTEPLAAAGANR